MSFNPLSLQVTRTVSTAAAVDRYCEQTMGASVNVRCRVHENVERQVGPHGVLLVNTSKVHMPADTTVAVCDRLTLPDGADRVVAHVARPADLRGQVQYVLATLV
jgi:hypothetical protein